MNKHQVSNSTPYLYAITRRDLSPIYAATQASHAIFAASQALHDSNSEQPHFCICTAKDEDSLRNAAQNLEQLGIRFTAWYEPDLDNQLTAIATECIYGEQRKHFNHFQLLKMQTLEVCA